MKKIIISSSNLHKISEIIGTIQPLFDEIYSLADFPDIGDIKEDGTSIIENSFIKSRVAFKHTHLPSMADDTVLEVDHLCGDPGIFTARYAGEHATYDENIDKLLNNNEIQTLITAFGAGFGGDGGEEGETSAGDFNVEKLRYHKIIIMTDADVDGSHIRTLLLTFLYRKMPELIIGGYVYIALPPLYKIVKGKTEKWVYTDQEKDKVLEEYKKQTQKIDIQRYKGLGEMNAVQLWETTMNPENRTLYRVTLEQLKDPNKVFSDLMGDDVEPRREFILKNAKYATNVDV